MSATAPRAATASARSWASPCCASRAAERGGAGVIAAHEPGQHGQPLPLLFGRCGLERRDQQVGEIGPLGERAGIDDIGRDLRIAAPWHDLHERAGLDRDPAGPGRDELRERSDAPVRRYGKRQGTGPGRHIGPRQHGLQRDQPTRQIVAREQLVEQPEHRLCRAPCASSPAMRRRVGRSAAGASLAQLARNRPGSSRSATSRPTARASVSASWSRARTCSDRKSWPELGRPTQGRQNA